jgi:hypothetical protein
MNCSECRELLVGYVENLLDQQQSKSVELHLKDCAACRAEAQQTRAIRERLISNGRVAGQSDIENAVMDAIMRKQALELRKTGVEKQHKNFWRLVMRNRLAQLAAAAVIIIAVFAGIYFITGKAPEVTCCAWADIIRPIMNAQTAEFDIIVGEEGKSPVIHDMVMKSKIRRTMEGLEDSVSIIDLETARILTLEHKDKKATYYDLKGLPQMPNYMDQLRNVIAVLEDSPYFVVDELGELEIDGQLLYGFQAKHPHVNIVLYVDPATALPVRIEQEEGQMKIICKNIMFDVPMDESLFSMDVPEGYKVEQQELDLLGSTEADFIEGLRVQAEVLGDGIFPDDVAVEHYLKMASAWKDKFDKLSMSDDEKTALGVKLQKGLMFIRFFKGEGKWYYAGKDVKLGDANTAIFWYKPAGSQTYHVIYGDLTIEDVNEEDLPQPVEEETPEPIGYQQWDKMEFIGVQNDRWHITASGQVEAHAHLRITKAPADTSIMTVTLPYSDANIVSVTLGDLSLPFNKSKWLRRFDVNLPIGKMNIGLTDINFVWTMPLDKLEKASYGYRAELAGLIPVGSYSLTIALDKGCGYVFSEEFSEEPSKPTLLVFASGDTWVPRDTIGETIQEPKSYFGSCGIPIEPEDKL